MTTDITELAQSLKAAAEKATPGEWVAFTDTPSRTFSVHTPDDKRCGDVIKWAGFDSQRKAKANAEFIALANPANILALVEAMEKAQRASGYLREQSAEWERKAISNFEDCAQMSQRIAELKSNLIDSDGLLEKAQQLIQTHERAELTWMNALELPDDATRNDILPAIHAEKYTLRAANKRIAELESRTVTVKLPQRYSMLFREGFSEDYRTEMAYSAEDIQEMLTAAGIKWEAE